MRWRRAASEPLIHLCEALAWLRRRAAIGPARSRRVLAELRNMWFGDRTRDRFVTLLRGCRLAVPEECIGAMLGRFERFELKIRDLARFLDRRPWRNG